MQHRAEQFDVGVIVGRFQVHELHDGHKELIDHVCSQHNKVIIFLGLSHVNMSMNNPLDFESRRQMIQAEYPDINILYIKDMPSDEAWSRKLDGMIADVVVPGQSVVLYGARDSFIDRYHGRFPRRELVSDSETYYSGTEVRRTIARSSARSSADFRAGVIFASANRHPIAYCTVDVAVLDGVLDGQSSYPYRRILLVRKHNERLFRFPGGFSEPTTPSLEADARREAYEETGVDITDPEYVGSLVVDDWRYRNERDKIKTTLWKAYYRSGRPAPQDTAEIAEVRWFNLEDLKDTDIHPTHRPLLALMRQQKGA
jgi:bifunctional NMN adenylyltransferase/nudix hydrolase